MKNSFGVLTLSYNKPTYIADAIRSVLAQTFQDFLYLIVENSTSEKAQVMAQVKSFVDSRIMLIEEVVSEEEREKSPMNVVLFDKYLHFLKDKVEYIVFLADDDELLPHCLEEISKYFEENPNEKACYHWIECVNMATEPPRFLGRMMEARTFGPDCSPDCVIDGGSFTFHTSCLDSLEYPYCGAEHELAFHSDGIFMARLTNLFPASPIPKVLSRKRWTEESCFGSKVTK